MTWGRIDAYRCKTGKTLAKVAEDLGVSVSMLMMVKTGRRNLSGKALYRLHAAERAAGRAPPAGADFLCVEPQSHAIGAPSEPAARDAAPLKRLVPGETLEGWLRIAPETL